MSKKHWFLSNNCFVDLLSSNAIAVVVVIAISQESWCHMLSCYHTSSWQSDAHEAIAHAATTLQAIRAVTMVDGLLRAASFDTFVSKWCEAPFRRLDVSSWPKAQVRVTSQMCKFCIVFTIFDVDTRPLYTICKLNIKLETYSYDFNSRSLSVY